MKFRYRVIFFIIGLIGLGIMVWQSDVTHIDWAYLLSPKILLLFAGLLGLWLIIYIIHTLCYYVILGRDGDNIPFFSLLKICTSGFALNNVTPAGLVGGEPYTAGSPLPAPVVTLLIALGFGAALVMYRNRKQARA